MNLAPRKDAVRQFWVAIRAGASAEDAVAGLGNNRKTGPRYSRKAGSLWFRQAGGVVPAYVTAQSSGRFLSFTEREEIHAGVERGDSIRLIAQGLGRAPSTVFHELRRLVQTKLKENLSPRQISVELHQLFPDDPEMWVSHETIYQSIYVQTRGALRRELAIHLRTGRALRKPRRRAEQRRGRIPNMVNISQRPAEVEDRAIPGHWEGDLMMGKS